MANPWELAPATPVNPWELTKKKLEVDESPFEVTPMRVTNYIKGEPQVRNTNQYQIDLARKGVGFDSPGEGPLSLKDYQDISYYSAGPDYARNYIGRKVKEKYAPDSEYTPDDLTRIVDGKIQYLDISQKKPRWKEVDTNTLYSFGKPAMWGEAITDVGATTLGTLGGGVFGPAGSAAGGAAASGVNSAAWRYNALKKGRELGINDGLDDEDIVKMAIGTGLVSGGTAGLFGAVGAWPRSAMERSIFSKNISRNISDDLAENLRKSGATADEINRIGKEIGLDEIFDPTTAQRSKIGEIKDIEATLEAGHAAKASHEISTEIKAGKNRDKRVLSQFWEALFPTSNRSLADVEDIGTGIRAHAYEAAGQSPEALAYTQASAAKAGVKQTVDDIDSIVNYNDLLDAVRGRPSPNGHIAGTKFYDMMDELDKAQKILVKEVELRGSNVVIPINDKNLILPELRNLRARLTRATPELTRDLGNTKIIEHVDSVIKLAQEAPDGNIPFAVLDDLHQGLGELIGKIQRSTSSTYDSPSAALLNDLAATIERAINTEARTGPVRARDLVESWNKRRAATTLKHDLFDAPAVRQALNTLEPDGKEAKAIFANALKPEATKYLEQLVNVAKNDPESMDALRKAALAQYKRAVTRPNGEVSLDAHNKWVADHRQQLDMLFPGEQPKPWAKVGALQQAVLEAEDRAKKLDTVHRDAWYKAFGEKNKYNSYALVKRLASGRVNTEQADLLITHLEKTDPTLLNLIRQEAQSEVRIKLGATDLPTAKSLKEFAHSTEGRNFSRLMGVEGETYLKYINTLSDAISMVTKEGSSLGRPSTNMMINMSRAYLGPLNRIQRFITGSKQAYDWMNAKDAYKVLSDPARLQRALQYAAMAPSQKSVPAAIMADIGALSVLFSDKGN